MKILAILSLIHCLGASLAFAQAKAPVNQQAGDCSVNITGSGNSAFLTCKDVDPKVAEQIRGILNGTQRNEKATKDISQKLDLILKEIAKGQKPADPPDVALHFVNPRSPALVIINRSAVIARDIKWTIVLWNMDLPDRNDPLPIPVSLFDWLRAKDKGGPENLFSGPLVAPLLKPGNRLYGSASVACPECSRGRTYIVHIVWGESGWFSELEDEKSGRPFVPLNFSEAGRAEYFKELETAVPLQLRTPISVGIP